MVCGGGCNSCPQKCNTGRRRRAEDTQVGPSRAQDGGGKENGPGAEFIIKVMRPLRREEEGGEGARVLFIEISSFQTEKMKLLFVSGTGATRGEELELERQCWCCLAYGCSVFQGVGGGRGGKEQGLGEGWGRGRRKSKERRGCGGNGVCWPVL